MTKTDRQEKKIICIIRYETDLVDLASIMVCELKSFEMNAEYGRWFEDAQLLLRSHFLLASRTIVQVICIEFLWSRE